MTIDPLIQVNKCLIYFLQDFYDVFGQGVHVAGGPSIKSKETIIEKSVSFR